MIPLSDLTRGLELEPIAACRDREIALESGDINRPGLQLAGVFDYFARERLQVIGKAEMTFLMNMSRELRGERLNDYFSYRPPCVVVCRNLNIPEEMTLSAIRYDVPLLRSKFVTTHLEYSAINFLNHYLAPSVQRHGVLIDVFGVGVYMTGQSGVGKSETALELVKRGHRLVADDAVQLRRVAQNRIVGEAPQNLRYYMELRGVGIINIQKMYGISAVIPQKSIDLVIHLEFWDDEKEYDRLGLYQETTTILGEQLPRLTIPVRPGRNLAIVIESAASNFRLKNMGYNAAQELIAGLAQERK